MFSFLMAYFIKILKAKTIKSKFLHYQEEKEIGLNAYESDFESYRKRKIKEKFRKWWLVRCINKIKTPKTTENVVCNSFLGFMGGVALTYIFFLLFHIAVNFSLKSSTYMFGLVGIVLCLGLAFSSKVRCYILLLLPVFFSKQGRQALLAYALFLAFTGPARNTMHNMEILSESMTCGQEMVKRTLKQIIEMVKAPFRSVKETFEKLSKALKEAIEPMKSFITKIKRIIVNILRVIKLATKWLGSIVNFCNKKVGTPFQRCMKTFDEAITDCKAKLGVMDFLCHVVHIVKALCYTVKWMDFICLSTEFVSEKVTGVVKKKLRRFGLHVKNLFYVSIEFTHSYEFETTASNSAKEVTETILQKISKKVEKLQNIFSFCGFMFSVFFILIFFKVYYYKYKFLSSDRYDNIYINKYIVELDIKRARMNRETVLPLEPKEKKRYAKPTTIRLLKDERTRISQSMFLLGLTSFKIITFIIVDYSLFWTLMKIYEAGRIALEEAEKSKIIVHVEGKGILSNFYRNLGNTMQIPENPNIHLNPPRCLPDPAQPDMGRYIQIGVLVALCWILTVTEAYGLRLRSVVMSHYYPDRARERAVWLYNHILRTRSSFLRFARRQLRKKFGASGNEKLIEKVTLSQRLFANFPILKAIFKKKNENSCLICGTPETRTERLKKCKTPDCQGRYCLECFASLENVCTICQHPIEYGDVSDISEEMDSEEEDLYKRYENEYDSDVPQENNKFLTFKDMEIRDRFRDVEAHKVPDYAKLGDLYHDKQALQRRLKEVLQRHIQTIEDEKNRKSQVKVNEYKQIRSKLQFMISNLQKKKQERIATKTYALRKKFEKKINNLKKFKESPADESEKLLGDVSTPTKSKVSFKLNESEELRTNYKTLKNEIKAKIKQKKNKSLNSLTSHSTAGEGSSHFKENREAEESSSEDSHKKNFMTYYFVEKEKEINFYMPRPLFNEKPNLNICFRFRKERKMGDKDFIL